MRLDCKLDSGELFLAAENRKYFFWVSTREGVNRFGDKSDMHWEIIGEVV